MTGDTRILAGPFNRVEGDLEIRLDIRDGQVAAAYANSPLFRGFETILRGKDPSDALTITPRICGICSVSQSAAAARALADAQGLVPTEAGAKVAALIHAVENLADHLTHFYLFFMPDFAKPVYAGRSWYERVVARMTAAEGAGIRAALEARAQWLHIMGLLAGKWPHTLAIQPGGVTKAPDDRDRVRILATVRAFRGFLERDLFGGPLEGLAEVQDAAGLSRWHGEAGGGDFRLFLDIAEDLGLAGAGKGSARFLSYGAYPTAEGPLFAAGLWQDGAVGTIPFDSLREELAHSWMLGEAAHPFNGATHPDADMAEPAYSWCKSPRLDGGIAEVGAIARQVVDGHPLARDLAGAGTDVRSRVVGRILEIARTLPAIEAWAAGLTSDADYMRRGDMPKQAQGVGLVEAARGALGHWLVVEKGRIANYQIIAPTTWNFSPRDHLGQPGPLEAALVGAPVQEGETTPIAVQHIVRSFDPCMVCTVH